MFAGFATCVVTAAVSTTSTFAITACLASTVYAAPDFNVKVLILTPSAIVILASFPTLASIPDLRY